ncbi:MAG: hypothetical protein ACE5J3_09415 [Methanosarcinales archaeon]
MVYKGEVYSWQRPKGSYYSTEVKIKILDYLKSKYPKKTWIKDSKRKGKEMNLFITPDIFSTDKTLAIELKLGNIYNIIQGLGQCILYKENGFKRVILIFTKYSTNPAKFIFDLFNKYGIELIGESELDRI